MFEGMKRGWSLVWAVGVLVCLITGTAWAYILPARYFFKEYSKSRSRASKMSIKQTTTYWNGTQKQTFEQRLYIRAPGKVRLETWRTNKRIQVEVWTGSQYLLWRKGQTLKRKRRRVQPRFDLFAVERSGSGYGNIRTLLRYMRINYQGVKKWDRDSDYMEQLNVSLTWFGRAPAVVMGAKPTKGAASNQLWFHKKQIYPVRYVAGWNGKTGNVDWRFLEYHVRNGVGVYPGRVRLYKRGKLAMESLVYHVDLTSSVPKRLFSQVP